MKYWICEIQSKVKAGVIVKAVETLETVLVRWSVPTMVDIDFERGIIHTDSEDTPWVEDEEEKALAVVGRFVIICSESTDFPNQSQIVGANMDFLCQRNGADSIGYQPGGLIIIHHDFSSHLSRGDSGTAFAEAISSYYQTKLPFSVYEVKANSSYNLTLAQLSAHAGKKIDRIIIATHGSPGQLWLGNPNTPRREDTLGIGARFVDPSQFGGCLRKWFGSGIAISICVCHVAAKGGGVVMQAIANAARARAVYAAKGEVFLHANRGDISSATSDGGLVCVYRYGFDPVERRGRVRFKIPLYAM